MEDGSIKKLYLIEQEFAIKESENSGNAYSLDHLLVDEDGIPVLVEVKRSTDTRIKREVVAQMLDYASRASKWDIKAIQDSFNSNNPDADPDIFIEAIRAKLTILPNEMKDTGSGLIISPEKGQFIDLRLLKDQENMARFQKAVQGLVDDIKKETSGMDGQSFEIALE